MLRVVAAETEGGSYPSKVHGAHCGQNLSHQLRMSLGSASGTVASEAQLKPGSQMSLEVVLSKVFLSSTAFKVSNAEGAYVFFSWVKSKGILKGLDFEVLFVGLSSFNSGRKKPNAWDCRVFVV